MMKKKKKKKHPGVVVTVIVMALMLLQLGAYCKGDLHPLILVPGSGGNQLEARLTKEYKPSTLFCRLDLGKRRREGWFRLWFDPIVLVAPLLRCFSERMTLYYDPVADDSRNAPGVKTRVLDFGATRSLLYLDPNLKHITDYMATVVESQQTAWPPLLRVSRLHTPLCGSIAKRELRWPLKKLGIAREQWMKLIFSCRTTRPAT